MEEVEALKAMYPEEGAVVMDDHGSASPYHSEQVWGDTQGQQNPLSGSVFFPGILVEGRRCGMHFQLPRNYPVQPPCIQVICEGGEPHLTASRSSRVLPHFTVPECCVGELGQGRGGECIVIQYLCV